MPTMDIFDLDLTVAPYTADPGKTTIDERFFVYAQNTPNVVIVLTGREDGRVNPKASSLTCDQMLDPLLGAMPLDVISSHGLACVTKAGEVHLHPALAKAQPAVNAAHEKIGDFEQRVSAQGAVIEKKITGVNVNVNQVAATDRAAILMEAADLLAEFVTDDSGLELCPEHGSLEARPKTNKRDGALYFIEKGIVPGLDHDWVFHCDSLGEKGTDRPLADFITNGEAALKFRPNVHSVVQVQHRNARYYGADERYESVDDHCEALLYSLPSKLSL